MEEVINRDLREISGAQISRERLSIELVDGFAFTVPLALFPTLLLASDEERSEMEVAPYSLHWEPLDCDLGIEGLLQGAREHPKLAKKAQLRAEERRHSAV